MAVSTTSQGLLGKNLRQLRSLLNLSQAKLAEKRRTSIESIVTEIRAVLNGLAQSRHYTVILDKSGESSPGVPVVLYTNGENDLTEDLVKELNANAPVSTTSEAKPDATKPAAK